MVDAVANQPAPEFRPASKLESFKVADPQYILSIDPATTIEEMENVLFQNVGGHEIISLARRDLVDGKNINYNIIADLPKLFAEYNSKTIASIENISPLYFNKFGIKFENYLPSDLALSRISTGLQNPVTIDPVTNNITIYVANMRDSYEVEVQAITSEELFRDTIYGGTES